MFQPCSPISIPTATTSTEKRMQSRLQLPSPLTGPESLAFDSSGAGPYTGVSDGRIFKYVGAESGGFVEFAYTTPNRNKTICDGIADFSTVQATCGRPLGIGFSKQTGELYIADAYHGLVKVPPNGGPAIQLVQAVQGHHFQFLDALDVDPTTGIVYFTEASSRFQFKDVETLLTSGDNSGSLLSYDPRTRETRVLMRGLAVAAGVAVSRDSSFVLVSEYMASRIQRFWLRGPRENRSEIFMQFVVGSRPDNIKRNSAGEFWISVNTPLGPPSPPRTPYLPLGVRVNEGALTLQVVTLAQVYGNEPASEVQEVNGALYTGSLFATYASNLSR
ncbi:protein STRICTOSIDINE SYNTHASE-LIKE 12 [Senna tora]|uniref:Protein STRICTOSIDINE SYNTHASE-LIKE 12 n=1 Tax=Senna tora TaxID=362788 RepID=A0A834X5G5_9FABA|nr:protein STRICTOSIDINE SYNTHASE-LIKE 12 [Senna tora]